jgi:hypothetical protein
MLEWLPWQDAAELAGVTAAGFALTRRSERRWARRLKPWAKEFTLILALYALWQYAGAWSLGELSQAATRGQQIWDAERTLHLPSERWFQQLVLPHHWLVKFFNIFYFGAHVPALGACLIWLFIRHRDRYPPVRTVVAIVTGASLAIQLVPVAPPRLLTHLGLVDTAAVFGPSVYHKGAPGLDQLAAMPSLHVGWALIVAGAVIWASSNRWRWLAAGFPVLTTLAVVVTGNHYWADAIVVAVLCAVATLISAQAYGLGGRRPPDSGDRPGHLSLQGATE